MKREISEEQIQQLLGCAKAVSDKAYAPYSNFYVGAAILSGSGAIYTGCNVENASYGLANCAERTAVFSAVAAGERMFKAVVIYTPTDRPTAPCGACRQVLYEFGPDAVVVSVASSGASLQMTVSELLPKAFGPKDLKS
jgi:cytidine deaminase